MYSVEQVAVRVEEIIRTTLKLGDDVALRPESDLVNEIGLDSIEAFESIATLHEMLGVRIPDDIDPKDLGSIAGIAAYVVRKYDANVVNTFMSIDVGAHLASMYDDGEFA
jgi:acyl carrier protein